MCSWYIVRYRVPWYLVHITIIVLFQLVDLHVYLVPASSWQTGRNLATQVIVETLIFHLHFISIQLKNTFLNFYLIYNPILP